LNYLLDTNIISELISKNPQQNVIDFIRSLNEKNIYLSVITIGEIKFGIDRLDKNSKRKKELNLWFHSLLNKFSGRILEIDIETMIIWSNITNTHKKEGITISIMDALIASSSIRYRMNLVTRNVKDFKDIKNLKYINPFE